jgi:hypothetical protein
MNASQILGDGRSATTREQDVVAQTHSKATEEPLAPGPLDWRIFGIVSAIVLMLVTLFVLGATIQYKSYQAAINSALAEPLKDHAAILSYNRARDAAIVKTSALFLGYLLVFTGALYVLRTASTSYRFGVKTERYAGTLQTSSPGLVISTLGILLIAVTIITRSDINYDAPSVQPAVAAGDYHGTDWQPVESRPSLPATLPPSERQH